MPNNYDIYLWSYATTKANMSSTEKIHFQKYSGTSGGRESDEGLARHCAAVAMGVQDATGSGNIKPLSDFTQAIDSLLRKG